MTADTEDYYVEEPINSNNVFGDDDDGDGVVVVTNGSNIINTPSVEKYNEWLGSEPHVFDIDIEKQGVMDILDELTSEEREQVEKYDKTMPIRYFRSSVGDPEYAAERIRETLAWREEIGIDDVIKCMHPEPGEELTEELVELRNKLSLEIQTEFFYCRGYTKEGRAIFCNHPTFEVGTDFEMQFLHTIYQLERAVACTLRKSAELNNGRPLEKFIFVGDYTGYSHHNTPDLHLLQRVFHAFTHHYPQRMECCYIVNPNLIMRTVYTLVSPFLCADTSKRIVMCKYDEDLETFRNSVLDIDKMESCFTHVTQQMTSSSAEDEDDDQPKEARPFDPMEYMNLPFNVGFDE